MTNATLTNATSTPTSRSAPVIGILALQGAFREHSNHLKSLPLPLSTLLVRTPSDLSRCSALIIPGGESTAICLGAQRGGLLDPLRDWVRDGKPTWGTCAGMILLSQQATGGKKGGQELIGGVDVRVGRNGWGSQVFSFETPLSIPCLSTLPSSSVPGSSNPPFNGVFIRAPIVEELLIDSSSSTSIAGVGEGIDSKEGKVIEVNRADEKEEAFISSNGLSHGVGAVAGSGKEGDVLRMSFAPSISSQSSTDGKMTSSSRPPIEILASLEEIPQGASSPTPTPKSILSRTTATPTSRREIPNRPQSDRQIVALRQGKILITSFHPELTEDNRLHEYWVREMVLK